MSDRYKGRIRVVGEDMMCFAADPVTLESLTTACYDPYAWHDPLLSPVEAIDISEWNLRRAGRKFIPARPEGT